MTPSVVPNALQASVCDEQLMHIGGEIALSRTTPPHHRRRNRHSAHSRFQSFTRAAISIHDCVPGFNDPLRFHNCPSAILLKSIHSMHPLKFFNLRLVLDLCKSCILQLVLVHCNSCVLEPVLHRFIHFNCFNRKLHFLGFLDSLDSLTNVSAQNSSIFDLPKTFVNISARFDSNTSFTTTKTSDECSCQFLFAKQLLLHSKNLYAMRLLVPNSSLQTRTHFLHHSDRKRPETEKRWGNGLNKQEAKAMCERIVL